MRVFRDNVVYVWKHVLGSPEDVHDVDVPRDIDQAPEDQLSEYLGNVGIVAGTGMTSKPASFV